MKKSFLLGAAAVLLAIGGAVATANSYAPTTVYYKTTGPNPTCTQATVDTQCTVQPGDCFETIAGVSRKLYNNPECTIDLRREL